MTTSGIILRELATGEALEAVCALHALAFGQADEAFILRTLHEDDENVLSLAAFAGDELAGHLQAFPIGLDGPGEARFCGIGPMAVADDRQRTGIGKALLERALETLAQRGFQRVFVLGDPAYYTASGFSAGETAGFSAPWGGPAFMAMRLNPGGPDFGALAYPSAFAESR